MDSGSGWDQGDEEVHRLRMEGLTGDIAAVYREVERTARGRPIAEVRDELERRLRERGVQLPPEALQLDDVARAMAEPRWPLKHPVEFLRWTRDRKVAAPPGDEPAEGDDPEWVRLERLLDKPRLNVTGMGKFLTSDGWKYVVRIDPWSERRARRIRRICAPVPVTVEPDRPGKQ
jgi:hypothetical protein